MGLLRRLVPRRPSAARLDYLVVGLGNPGPRYARSPHNIGFMVVDWLAERESIRIRARECKAVTGAGDIGGHAVALAKPQTFMNLSGTAVEALLRKHSLPPARLIVVYDDHDLPWSAVRIRAQGSAGGHHGMESIVASLGTTEFARVRVGINPGRGKAEPEFLLRPLAPEQRQDLDDLVDYSAQAVASIISEGVAKAMTKFNRRAQGEPSEET
jgi:PTH1 family peptidyl-tRNA hydrolase